MDAGIMVAKPVDIQISSLLPAVAKSLQTAAMRTDMTVAQTASQPIIQTATGYVARTPTSAPTSYTRFSTQDPAAKSYPVSQPIVMPKQPDVPQPTQPMAPAPAVTPYSPSPGQQVAQCLPGYIPHPSDPTLCVLASQQQPGAAGAKSQLPLIAVAAVAALMLMR
jgi:hypothetical protein